MIKLGRKTAEYQRELRNEHRMCTRLNDAVIEVKFDSNKKQYYVLCSDCVVYVKESDE